MKQAPAWASSQGDADFDARAVSNADGGDGFYAGAAKRWEGRAGVCEHDWVLPTPYRPFPSLGFEPQVGSHERSATNRQVRVEGAQVSIASGCSPQQKSGAWILAYKG